jgi:putative tryptophan/tyrosine transport system substrate-binding protein
LRPKSRAAAIRDHLEGKKYRIAFLGSTSPSGYASQVAAFREGLRDLGYVEDHNLVIEFRWAHGNYERLPELAAELVRSKPDVLVTRGPPGALAATARPASQTGG